MKRIVCISVVLILALASPAYTRQRGLSVQTAGFGQRVALVIGNSAYENAPLKNPINDARDMAHALRELGFDIIHRENVNRNDLKRAIRAFGEKLRGSDVGLFYYAGHGVQVKGINYLIPVDAKVESEEEVEYEAIDVGFVLAQMEAARNSMNIVILDACRNNPFARSYRSNSRGLAQMDAPSGTLIAYATAPGSVASDGNTGNGLYTQELLKNILIPGLNIEEVFKRVRVSVRGLTQEKQTPWESSSLIGNFFFKAPSENAAPKDKSGLRFDGIYWNQWITGKNSVAHFFFKFYKNGDVKYLLLNHDASTLSDKEFRDVDRKFDYSYEVNDIHRYVIYNSIIEVDGNMSMGGGSVSLSIEDNGLVLDNRGGGGGAYFILGRYKFLRISR